ncbi:MAG: CHAT domain-containing protein [Bacteroidia bacterium]|nr:CHAT domain-containing protein [Bacteroidia bacterium]
MDRRFWLIIALIAGFTSYRQGCSQESNNAMTNLDSIIKVTTNMLNPAMIDLAKIKIDSLLDLCSGKKIRIDLLTELKIRSLHGKYLLQKQENDKWPALYEWCNKQESLCKSEEELTLLAKLFNNAGIAFKRLGRLSDSEEAYLKSCEFLRKLKHPDYILLGSVYTNAGNALKQIGEFEHSIDYFTQSIGFFDQFVDKNKGDNAVTRIADQKSKALNNLGLVYQSLADHKKAIEVFQSCIDFKQKHFPVNIFDVYGNLVISLIEDSAYQQAKTINKLIINDFQSGKPLDRSWAMAKVNQADINLRSSPRSKADSNQFYREMNLIIETIVKKKILSASDVIVISNQNCANLLLNQDRYESALVKWSEAMKSLSQQNKEVSPDEIPFNLEATNDFKLIELMNLNAKIFYIWGTETNDIRKYKKAEDRYYYSLKLIDSLRNKVEMQSSKLQVSRMQRETYNTLIELEYNIFHLTGDSTYISKLFNTIEQCKSASLWSSVKDVEFKTSFIPQVDLDKENSIRQRVADVQGKIIEANAAQNVDQKKIGELQQELFFYNQQIESLITNYRQKYPDYFRAKFDRSTLSLDQVSRMLTPNQVMVEYAIAFDSLYILTVNPFGSTISRVLFSGKTKKDIGYLLEFMKGNAESLTSSARKKYCEAAAGLKEILLGSTGSIVLPKEIIIIPDGVISYIPFEALLDTMNSGTRQDYRKLPYLIRNHSFSYGLTATIFFYKPTREIKPLRSVLAVAPGYNMSSGKISDFMRKAQDGLPELKGTFQESRAIKKMIGGKLLLGNNATEAKFKSIVSKYGILHLAMHTIPNKSNSLNSGLVFTPGADDKEDGILFGHEVYNLSLNAWLTVLSACETGSGQMAGGEGILSFGRAFIFAGCPNLIMTMWTVDDRSSKELMIKFYQSILSGSNISDALQKSKLDYLGKADQLHAHPHFWAGFIELGKNQVLDISPKKPGLIYLLLFSSLIVLGLVFLQVKKNPRRRAGISWKRNSRKL